MADNYWIKIRDDGYSRRTYVSYDTRRWKRISTVNRQPWFVRWLAKVRLFFRGP